jgi:hypothetical protein
MMAAIVRECGGNRGLCADRPTRRAPRNGRAEKVMASPPLSLLPQAVETPVALA